MSEAPARAGEAAAALESATTAGQSVRVVGGRTKLAWGRPTQPEVELSTALLDRIVEHNAGDLTAVLEAGVPLGRARETFAAAGQMLALDPPGEGATVGGIVATADSGPLRSRYGAARDLVIGVAVALPDGTVARAGGKVIKNVAGYDLGKLLAGSFGTLGAIVEVAVRLHPLPERTATAAGGSSDPAALGDAALELSHAPLEPLSLDVSWSAGTGAVLARFGGVAARAQAESAGNLLARAGLERTVIEEDRAIWERQRDGQRSGSGTVVRVSGLPTELARVLRAAGRRGARVVGRAGLGLSWLRLEDRSPVEAATAVADLRRELEPAACVVLDAPAEVRERVDPWGPPDPGALALARRVKERFDPTGACNPGVFIGGI